MGSEKKASVAVMDTKGPMVETGTPPVALSDINTAPAAKYIAGSGFAAGVELKTHKDGDEITGTYAGAPGKYTCGTGCSSQVGNGGVILTGSWTFAADAREPKFMGDDPRYAEFGWWLDEEAPGAKAGAWYGLGGTGVAFADDNGGITNAQITAASGSATYEGHAIGQVAFYNLLGEEANIGGAFTADAKLTADFGANAGAGSLKGDITGFSVGGVDVPEWSVELMEHAIAGVGVADDLDPAPKTKWTLDGTAAAAAGDWSAAFYDKPENEHQPKGVAGGFVSHYGSDGRMVGAFGAER